jgi:MoxR-like ATPase/tetratricopeptide (TPR) repeat protein
MSLTYEQANALFSKGEFGDLVRLYGTRPVASRAGEEKLRHVVAHALALMGNIERAGELIRSNGDTPRDLTTSGWTETIRGLIAEKNGNADDSIRHYQCAIRLATESSDLSCTAWAHLHLFRFLGEARPSDADGMVHELRRTIARAGDPVATAYLHVSLSVMEGQRGRTINANRHCDIAESISSLSPNVWVTANVLMNRGCIAILECRFGEAVGLLNSARAIAEQAGLALIANRVDANLGHVLMLRGEFEKATTTVTRVLNEFSTTLFRLGALDNLARIELATNRLGPSSKYLEDVHRIATAGALQSFYHARWAGLTKARLLRRRGELLDALDLLLALSATADEAGDRPLASAVHLLNADILEALHRQRAASRELLSAVPTTQYNSDLPQYWFVAGRVIGNGSSALGRQLQNRAVRQWNELKIISPQLELVAPSTSVPQHQHRDSSSAALLPPRDNECMADSVAAAFDLACHPRLLGTELLAITRGLKCSPDAKLVETRLHEPEPTSDGIVLPLGTVDKKKLTLVCAAPEEPAAAVLLGDVLRIGRAALELEKARQDERNRAALWPASPIEEQAGALFLAEEMQTLLATARRIATTNVPILITGETGTGKEVLARTIHAYSQRAAKTFLPFNCTATPREMLDAQLFGHRRGAFTGATDSFPGIIRAASGGTLFLDEIGETTLDVQPKLLRFLESGEVHPLGETHPAKVDVRVITATNADLDGLVAQGRFREDLFYRLNIVRLHVPPLRERRVEIPALANHYLEKHSKECGKRELRLSEETMEYLVLYVAGQRSPARQRDASHGRTRGKRRGADAGTPLHRNRRLAPDGTRIRADARTDRSRGQDGSAVAGRGTTPRTGDDPVRTRPLRRPHGSHRRTARPVP